MIQLNSNKMVVEFGLLDCLYNKKEKGSSEITKIRKTKLFDKFMKFEL